MPINKPTVINPYALNPQSGLANNEGLKSGGDTRHPSDTNPTIKGDG
jgi:hypothetical protein